MLAHYHQLAKVKDEANGEKGIEMLDCKSQPSKCGICIETLQIIIDLPIGFPINNIISH